MIEYKESIDRTLEVYQDGRHRGTIKKIMSGWRFFISGQRHIVTPILHSRTEVQKWFEATNGDVSISYEPTKLKKV